MDIRDYNVVEDTGYRNGRNLVEVQGPTSHRKESVYCGKCVSMQLVPMVTGSGFRPICRMYETPCRTDRTGKPVKDPKCMQGCNGNYV